MAVDLIFNIESNNLIFKYKTIIIIITISEITVKKFSFLKVLKNHNHSSACSLNCPFCKQFFIGSSTMFFRISGSVARRLFDIAPREWRWKASGKNELIKASVSFLEINLYWICWKQKYKKCQNLNVFIFKYSEIKTLKQIAKK